jgi:hypothetical protein
MLFLLSSSVLAATIDLNGVSIDDTKILQPASGKYTLAYTEMADEMSSGQEVVLLAIRGLAGSTTELSITADNILYIDQAQSDGTSVSYNSFIPKVVEEATLLLGGATSDGNPKIVGHIVTPSLVSGYVSYVSPISGRTATLVLQDKSNPSISYTLQLTKAGSFSLQLIPNGTYSLTVTTESHTSYTYSNMVINGDNFTNLNCLLRAGDVNSDEKINFTDLSTLIDDYNKTVTTAKTPKCDVNGDAKINFTDLSTLIDNYNKSAIVE